QHARSSMSDPVELEKRFEQLFEQVTALPPDQRVAFLDQQGVDIARRRRLESVVGRNTAQESSHSPSYVATPTLDPATAGERAERGESAERSVIVTRPTAGSTDGANGESGSQRI